MSVLKDFLEHPLTRGLDVDDPRTTALRRQIIREKPFLRKLYDEWYRLMIAALPTGQGGVLELGSGGGFLSERLPGLITSDILPCPGVSRVIDAHELPFAEGELRAIVMANVFHHLAQPRRFLAEAARCVRPGGALVMLEPWVTAWSRWVYTRLHTEPFEPTVTAWEFPPAGPLSGANGAMPWIIFARDRARFEAEFPAWQVGRIRLLMPWRYLLSGGVSMRSLMPGWSFGFWRGVEWLASPWMNKLALFALIVVHRPPSADAPRETAP